MMAFAWIITAVVMAFLASLSHNEGAFIGYTLLGTVSVFCAFAVWFNGKDGK